MKITKITDDYHDFHDDYYFDYHDYRDDYMVTMVITMM